MSRKQLYFVPRLESWRETPHISALHQTRQLFHRLIPPPSSTPVVQSTTRLINLRSISLLTRVSTPLSPSPPPHNTSSAPARTLRAFNRHYRPINQRLAAAPPTFRSIFIRPRTSGSLVAVRRRLATATATALRAQRCLCFPDCFRANTRTPAVARVPARGGKGGCCCCV